MSLPEFKMPTCFKHFFNGHKWWCRACDRETESQFQEIAEAYWRKAAIRPDVAVTEPVHGCCDHSKAHPSPFACTCRKHPPSHLHPYGEAI